ncbi:gluconate 2-dehydrogenase subunit 3 family protein [Thalassotalea euphylliae]|uniref:Gluconate 2-dehydrogenase subunit 3 family protein n=1 Tax=Thalassotalea euphylliae TaxID=1655234 RepID=A0A3E0TLR3_9GAMM|nr:gluconate 2-dehydrogenase subunit 3 family protein [Thalassotalea euphylliae]REL25277.1 gluconate 2-dehydrogenase subunit 3 family protein [Thalassotalea euphylliae]
MSFFDPLYKTPRWLERKLSKAMSRRQMLKSAAGATAVAAMPLPVLAAEPSALASLVKQDPWLTLDTVLEHLLPSSASGPGAKEIQALAYLYNVVDEQPIDSEEKAFIEKGVGWLNGFSHSQLNKPFVELSSAEKETVLRKISGSRAGHNWINTLINYLYEAMLSPPAYGGNPNGIGWQWLNHKAGFPLPSKGNRFYEIPGRYRISVKNLSTEEKRKA